ncbi:MAG: hypothetical protein ABIB71_04260 [Candidatus Woesearchaeota archaeon]
MKKKGSSWIAWVLAMAATIALTTAVIFWSKGQVATLSEDTINFVSGKEECKMVRIDAWGEDSCTELVIENKGYVKISNARIILDNGSYFLFGSDILPLSSSPREVGDDPAFTTAEIMPIVEVKGETYGCRDKVLGISCP